MGMELVIGPCKPKQRKALKMQAGRGAACQAPFTQGPGETMGRKVSAVLILSTNLCSTSLLKNPCSWKHCQCQSISRAGCVPCRLCVPCRALCVSHAGLCVCPLQGSVSHSFLGLRFLLFRKEMQTETKREKKKTKQTNKKGISNDHIQFFKCTV